MSMKPGWYDDGSGRRRWFDGRLWADRYLDPPPPAQPPPPKPGTEYHPAMDAAAAPDLQPKKSRGALWGCLGCLGLVAVVSIGFAVAGSLSKDKPYDANNKYEAIAQCESRIENLLKSPSTAKFDSDATGSGTWTVTGTVDSENGFGAMLRSNYQCTVVIKGDSATTTVDFLE